MSDGILQRLLPGLFAGRRAPDTRSGYGALEEVLSLRSAPTGVSVTTQGSLQTSAVFACVRILAETVGSLPLIVYERQARGRRRARDFYLYDLLHDAPNPLMTAVEFREALQGHLALWGNAYAEIEYDRAGRITALWPLRPDHMLQNTIVDGRRLYQYQAPDGGLVRLTGDRVWHLRGLGSDGLNGYSPIALHRRSVELARAAEEFGARFFGNDARPGVVLRHPGHLGEQAMANLRASWTEAHGGLSRAHRVAILEEGMDITEVGIPPQDAQYLELRRFQVEEIARIYRIPPHMLADLSRATFSNIEHQGIEFVEHTMRPWFVRWEQSISHNLMLSAERERYYAEFLVDALLRGDTASRYQAYAQGRQNGWLSANDIRELENMNPVEGGDQYLVPLNMVPVSAAATPATPAAPQAPAPRQAPGGEERSLRAVTARQRLRDAYLEIYRDAAARLLRREVHDVGARARKTLRTRDIPAFNTWLDEYYAGLSEAVVQQMTPVNRSYATAVLGEAAEEVGRPDGVEESVEAFTTSYTGGYAARHTGISLALLRGALQEAQNSLETEPLDAVEAELGGWEEGRAGAIAEEESTRLGNAVAKTVFVAAGFFKLRWRSVGETCPYCRALDGRVIDAQANFLNAGESLEPDGADGPLSTTTDIGHPPAHTGCNCQISPAL